LNETMIAKHSCIIDLLCRPTPRAAHPASPVGKRRELWRLVMSQAALGQSTPGG